MTDPGWYPNPTDPGSLRWFDGSVWTEHVAPGSEAPAPSALTLQAPSAPPAVGSTPPVSTFGVPSGVPQLADFGTRLGAYLIDALIVVVPFWLALVVAGQIASGLGFLVMLGGIGVIAWYFATGEGGPTGQTIGKRQLGIAVVDATSLKPGIGSGRAVGRYLSRIVSAMPCGLPLGYLWMLWDDDKQTWHDKIVSTKVIKL